MLMQKHQYKNNKNGLGNSICIYICIFIIKFFHDAYEGYVPSIITAILIATNFEFDCNLKNLILLVFTFPEP